MWDKAYVWFLYVHTDTECISHHFLCLPLENTLNSLTLFTSDVIYSCVSRTGSAEILLGFAVRIKLVVLHFFFFCAEALSQPVSLPLPFSLPGDLFFSLQW